MSSNRSANGWVIDVTARFQPGCTYHFIALIRNLMIWAYKIWMECCIFAVGYNKLFNSVRGKASAITLMPLASRETSSSWFITPYYLLETSSDTTGSLERPRETRYHEQKFHCPPSKRNILGVMLNHNIQDTAIVYDTGTQAFKILVEFSMTS